MRLLFAFLAWSPIAFAETSKYAFDCNALSALTKEGGQATGSFTIENGKGNAGFGYPPLGVYAIQILYKIDLSTIGASSAVMQILDTRQPELVLASSNSILHFDGLDQIALKLNLPDGKNEISIQCSLKPTN